jgi:hypothetical protein
MKPDEKIEEAFEPILEFNGFGLIKARRWVRDEKAPIREIFEMQALKGGVYSPRWGFSLDFVPNYSNGKFMWARTNKSCQLDLCIDPVDTSGFPGIGAISEFSMTDASMMKKAAHESVSKALSCFARVTDLVTLENLYQERSQLSYRRFSFRNYIQVYLAWGILLLKLGRKADGEDKLAQFSQEQGADLNDPFLLKAISAL